MTDTDAQALQCLEQAASALRQQLGLAAPPNTLGSLTGSDSASRVHAQATSSVTQQQPPDAVIAAGSSSRVIQSPPFTAQRTCGGMQSACSLSPYHASVEHSLDLSITDEPAFLLASTHLETAKLRRKRGQLHEAAAELDAALALFPCYVAALLERGQVRSACIRSA